MPYDAKNKYMLFLVYEKNQGSSNERNARRRRKTAFFKSNHWWNESWNVSTVAYAWNTLLFDLLRNVLDLSHYMYIKWNYIIRSVNLTYWALNPFSVAYKVLIRIRFVSLGITCFTIRPSFTIHLTYTPLYHRNFEDCVFVI